MFMDDDFLLHNEYSKELYHNYAKDMPIFDYHCHLDPKEIYEDVKYDNITQVWLYGDHYKWRAMRANGIEEKYITGDGSDHEKFLAWAKTIPMAMGNPLYHWTHLELKRYFNIDEVLNEKNAEIIWEKANKVIRSGNFSARQLIANSNVKALCTTDDPVSDLKYHVLLKECKDFDVKVLPTFRPDRATEIADKTFKTWLDELETASSVEIKNYEAYLQALKSRVKYFNSVGCRLADHSLTHVPYEETTKEEASKIFDKAIKGESITKVEEDKFKTYTLYFFMCTYSEFDWVVQLHIGAMRSNNTLMFNKIGKDTGFDSPGDENIAFALSRLMDLSAKEDKLPKTVLYTLNPKDNYVLSAMAGNFQGGGIPGKIQYGAAWWFNDHKDGMIDQMKALYNCGLLSRFIGMLTDSRSFLSYARHEYFRRILCSLVGQWIKDEEVPNDMEFIGKMIQNICYNNVVEYIGVQIDK